MKGVILFYSGTGNTALACQHLARRLPPGFECVDVTRPRRVDLAGIDVVGFATPTDFWQQTHYGFRADNGHFLSIEVAGDFSITTKVRFHPVHQYDQAGLMIRVGPMCWIKASVEHEPQGPARLGAVVTNHGFSDWSVQDFPRETREVCLRIRKEDLDFIIEFASNENAGWNQMRIAQLNIESVAPPSCGLYACSPKGSGFRAEFEFMQIARTSE